VLGPEDLVDEETDSTRMVMTVVNEDNCSGCVACASTCPKGCFSLKPMAI
jgi:NAD-dependent dihydropyrimidine dehydrogenase PreA subunit